MRRPCLASEQRNGVWARIIKNAFAPLFVGQVDYIVGNPPWVNWESLPSEYREATLSLWDKYRLRERAVSGSRLGNVKKELSALFVYATMDHYLPKGGSLGFVTQSIFKSGACEGFRRFQLDDARALKMERVCDLSLCLPFEGAINRTATILVRKGPATKYPVPYKMWIPKVPRSSVPESSLEEVKKQFTVRDWLAAPVEPSVTESPWLTAEKKALPVLQKVIGDRSSAIMDRAYAGSCTWLNGVYWLEQLKADAKGVLIRNLADVGRNKVQSVTKQVESDFLYPLLRGRDVQAWNAKPTYLIAVPHDPAAFSQPVPLSQLKAKFPQTYSFFREFEEPLRKRSGYKQLLKSRPEFYAIGNVGGYTLAPYKVVFKDLTEVFQCAVVGPQKASRKAVVPDHTVLFLTSNSENEAHFLCGLLNSIPVRVALYGASVGVQTQRYFPTDVSRVRLPEFAAEDKRHQAIVRLSRECHSEAGTRNDSQALKSLESELAVAASSLWGISEQESAYLTEAYGAIRNFRRQRDDDESEDAE